jgi:hypothetical protein
MVALAVCAAAQPGARLQGRVYSTTNAPLGGVRVLVRCLDRQTEALSDPTGQFAVDRPAGAVCRLSTERRGYFPVVAREIDAETAEVRLVLNPVQEMTETIEVTAGPVALDLDTSPTQQRVSGADLVNAPFPATNSLINGLRILPGVVQGNPNSVFSGPSGLHLNGGGSEQVFYSLDGFNIGDPLTGNFDSRLAIEAVQSVEVVSGPAAAEFGKGSAGTLALRTRSGDDRLRARATNFVPGIENRKGLIIGNFTPRVFLSGPWRRGRAWWSNGSDLQYDHLVVPELPRGQDSTASWRWSNVFHTQVNLSPGQILSGSVLLNQWIAPRTGLGALDPPETTVDRRSRQQFATIKDQIYLGRGMLVEFGYAANHTFARQIPQGEGETRFTGAGKRGNWFRDMQQKSSRDQVVANLFLPALGWRGSHQLKAGLDVNRLDYWQDVRRTGFTYERDSGVRLKRTQFAGSGRLERANTEAAIYIQDAWKVRAGLLVEGGFRWDWDQLFKTANFAPRIGAAWAPARWENTRISGGVAVIYDAANLQMFVRPDDQYSLTWYYGPDGETSRGPALSFFRPADERLRAPGALTYSAAWERRFPRALHIKLGYLGKRGVRGLNYLNTPPGPDEEGMVDVIYRLVNQRQDRYDAAEMTVRQSLRGQHEWLASYILSSARSNSATDLSIDEPQLIYNNSGPLPWDSPHRFVSWGYLPTPWSKWSLAYLTEWRSGFPYSVVLEDGQVEGAVNARRFPRFFEMNVHVERRLQWLGRRWAVRGGVNNVTGRPNPIVVNNIMGSPHYGAFYGGFGRALNFRIRWLGGV